VEEEVAAEEEAGKPVPLLTKSGKPRCASR